MRLIVQIESGDGCTFSCVELFPVLFSSKEEFIITLEDKLVQIEVELEKHNKKMQKHQEHLRALFAKCKVIGSVPKEISTALAAAGNLQQEKNRLQEFQLGGAAWTTEMFVREGKIALPDVFTADEYFAGVENNE